MHKTKPISKDFIRDCRIERERQRSREDTVYQFPQEPSLLQFSLPDCHSLFPQDAYSLDDFIHNLQADQFFHYGDAANDDPPPEEPLSTRPSIDTVNHTYLQCMGEGQLEGESERVGSVSFCTEVRTRYFREQDAACVLVEGQEFMQELEESPRDMWSL